MDMQTYARRVEKLRPRLYRIACCYLGSETAALDAIDEAVYRGLRGLKKLRQEEFFDTWLVRILLNECAREKKRWTRLRPLEDAGELTQEAYDHLPLRQAVQNLPKELKDVVILRFFVGLTQLETAETLEIPQGTVATRQRRALRLLKLDLEEVVL